MEKKYIKVPCTCECHNNKDMMHIMPCCDGERMATIDQKYIEEISICGLTIKVKFVTGNTKIFEYKDFEQMQKGLHLNKEK